MAITEFESQIEPELPKITMLREYADERAPVYHFYIDGEESSVELSRETDEKDQTCHTYHFRFFGWEFASAEVKAWPELSVIEYQGLAEGLDELATLEAQRLMTASQTFLLSAITEDFPQAYAIEGPDGDLL